ncbi:hypothetical protein A2333_03190 [Candidatus Wolfebacteria bacterium RIFOXYB2_FULL_49_7]|uniref:3D domain-containing protein n=1 Tax=Candidatus Wolfebacteria bacterium RIFOXYB1_FULL_54_12 TaxID=1802559 RepID=A0A1F8DXK2_9BACT|nr:MAG: hypothetical protein A2372_02395 [Candidatus Wolfebacteria bacterium RIFOXYB1_FULL_54_12]OGM94600.1 MAG: hypothetical protein A2333_03190 [Candidatus Wolfebacteria bacterium RIFOXYB2_FULL_49_7]
MKTYGTIAASLTLLAIFCSPDTISHASLPPEARSLITKTITKNPSRPIVAVTSAYYRPVKGQRKYVTGSYLGDIRLNGTGVTSSGKRAEIGHLSADLRYNPVGTKFRVVIDGKNFGQWTVEDKGGGIKGPHRFDFFVGENDTGRIAAQSWGRRGDHKIEMYRVGKNG